ncbi:hypothetical protein [Halobaculum rarum]|uniref:hypothetical protein n=1 Tax=Halobaculum rarum TaxID=3075122 RepID=UPI0032AEABAC
MSLWRAKRKYEANQGLNETADDALLAIAILQSESDEFGVYTSQEVEENLKDGCEILQGIHDAIENPNEVSSYYLALADHLRTTGRKQTTNQFSRDLETATTALAESSESLRWESGLNKAKQLLQRVEEFTSETSKRNVDHMRGNLAGGAR